MAIWRSSINRLQSLLGISSPNLGFGNAVRWRDFALLRMQHVDSLYRRISEQGAKIEELKASFDVHLADVPRLSTEARSVVFLNNSYYNFIYLARALRKRGWDAISVSFEDPNGPNKHFLHGSDLCLYDPDATEMKRNIAAFQADVARRFRMVHFYGRGHMSILPHEYDSGPPFSALPMEFMRLKQRGVKIGYSVCGCLDGVAQSSVQKWSGCCDRCVWQHSPHVCADRGNLAWGHKVEMFCDVICCEGFPALDFQSGPKTYREPLTTALDPQFWRPDLDVPEKYKLPRDAGELIVYHAVGNFETRASPQRHIKGTSAVVAAIERLKSEGMKVRLEFVTNVPNTEVRFIQAQADVIVDQLNYGRYGAAAREGMMLGKPTICYMIRDEPEGQRRLESIETCPLVSANEDTVLSVLRDLLLDEEKRKEIGAMSRAYAMKWHDAEGCAERFEKLYDRLQLNLHPE